MVCNHQSLLDGLILALALPNPMVFPVTPKHSVQNGFTRRALALLQRCGLGWVEVMNSDHPWSIRALARSLRAGVPVVIFPEGQIAGSGGPLPEKRGAEWLCRLTGAELVRAKITGAGDSRLFGKAGTKLWPKITVDL
jgi:acyl-[acyl-carrier-protein]-phospholipid O-acyltransferase/long-chain-fatty-acid--[acyl-carrier-protein] ligase